ncbi:alpha/beta hydrolase [Glycomyces sp. NPDC049804]|uniref:alpha/beta hydrolase n=1 Tax=Glycomyces sp. NPDC049804 TaxID=3154363 RepID=UPI00341FAC49
MSEMHWKDLKETDFSALKTLADLWGTYINDMTAQSETISEDVVNKHLSVDNYESETADDVRHQAELLADSLQDDLHEYAMVKIKATLEDAHDELVACQAQLFELIDTVTGSYRFEGGADDPYVVISDGHRERISNLDPDSDVMARVGVTETMLSGDPIYVQGLLLDGAQQIADEYGSVLQAIMTRAHNSDDQAAAILKSIVDTPAEQPPPLGATYDDLIDDYETADAERNRDFLHELASGESEATANGVNDWWTSLAEEERAALIESHPDLVGGLDGIPSGTRDGVNRDLLEAEIPALENQIANLETQIDHMEAGGSPYGAYDGKDLSELQAELSEAQGRLANAEALQTALANGSQSGAPLLLIDYDSGEDGKAVVSIGNPDTASHNAVYVPGTTADMQGVDGLIADAGVMQFDADKAGNGETAVTMWLDYDAPDGAYPGHSGDISPEAWETDQAEEARSSLNSYLDGLTATHDGEPHTTVLGHSYGSSVVGATAAEYQVEADQIIDFASPGLMVDTADELSVGGDNVYSSRADHDVINAAVSTGALGADPTGEFYGGNTFESDAIGSGPIDIHSGYLREDAEGNPNQARDTMAQIITGQQG